MISKHSHQNRLVSEKSPYLLQHAGNPVEWYPWGEEAFQEAVKQDKPIFLSIGYASCHWCHVMEKESFEDEAVADLMNKTFINIKVDREELPEVDNLYMEFAQSLMSGSAGWPLNVLLTPSLKPFFATTYLPPRDKNGMMGLTNFINKISEVWHSTEREEVFAQSEQLVRMFTENLHLRGNELPDASYPEKLASFLYKLSDPIWGGFSGSPKFPIGYQSLFLIRHYAVSQDARALFLVEKTHDMMHRGGIFDHLGGGFSRYSIDEAWIIPHFEKMLYDNALLIEANLELYQASHKELFKKIAEDSLDYILSSMTSPEGPFYSAEDADSEGKEGAFYTWKREDVLKLLGKQEGVVFCDFYGITEEGNFDENLNVLHITLREAEFSEKMKLDRSLVNEVIEEGKQKLLAARIKREPPFKDDKVLTSWNGLMIQALAKAALILNNPRYLDQAKKAALFIKTHLFLEGRLYRRFRDGEVRFKGGLEDYAFLIRALLTLYQAGGGSEWFLWAQELNQILKTLFKCPKGAYYFVEEGTPHLILRKALYSDGAEPSGNAIQCENLLRLSTLTLDDSFSQDAEDILRAVKPFVDNYSPGYTYHLMNVERYLVKDNIMIIISLNNESEGEREIREALRSVYIPFLEVQFIHSNEKNLFEKVPNLKPYRSHQNMTTFYLCRQGVCDRPLTELSDIQEAILKLGQKV